MRHNRGRIGIETQEDVLERIHRGHANAYLRQRQEAATRKRIQERIVAGATAVAVILAVALVLVLAVEALNYETERSLERTHDVRLVACERQHSAEYCAERVTR